MSSDSNADRYGKLRKSLQQLPYINAAQVEQWVNLERTIDATRDYLIRAVPQAQLNVEEAEKILAQRTYTLVFFGGTGVGKSTLINALLGRNLLPTGPVTAVTGTIVYIEQADEGEPESLTLNFWSRDEFASRVRRLCQLSELGGFDITNAAEREQAREDIEGLVNSRRDNAKTERDEYLEILLDCINTYEVHQPVFQNGPPPPQVLPLNDEEALKHLREDGFKSQPEKRQIRLVRSATFRIQPRAGQPNLLMDGHLRVVDVPGLGAGMKLHEAITLEEMKREDAMIVLVTDAGRQRVDEMKSLAAVNWIKENRLYGLTGSELDDAAAKIFVVVNGGNVRQAFDRLNSGLPGAELEVKEMTRYIAPNYWERYADRGHNRPYFLVMAPTALYVQDPDHAPKEFESETERILKVFHDQLGNVNSNDSLDPATKSALLNLSEVPLLRERLIDFIRNERVRSQLREAASRVRNALQALRFYYEKQLAASGVHPPFATSWESLQERRYENVLIRQQRDIPRAFHNALLDLSQRYNSDEHYRALLRPTLYNVRDMVQDAVQREIEVLLESYGTEHWDDRDVTYDSLIWGTSGIEVPIKRILYQVELMMQEAVSNFMPEVADVVAAELEQTLDAHDVLNRLERATYGQNYSYSLPDAPGETLDLNSAYDLIVQRVVENFRQICRQATMYELVRPERSIHQKLALSEEALALPDNGRVLDAMLEGPDTVRREWQGRMQIDGSADQAPAAVVEEEIAIHILDEPLGIELDITFPGGDAKAAYGEDTLEASYAEKLDNIAVKVNRIFQEIVDDLFNDELLLRLRRLFWLEATKAERDFNNHIVKPMLRQHDRKLHDEELRKAMEVDLESVSDLEELMRTWEGLHRLEMNVST